MKKIVCVLIFFLMFITYANAESFNVNNFGAKYTYEFFDEPKVYSHSLINADDDFLVRYSLENGEKHTKKIGNDLIIYQDNSIILVSSHENNNKSTVLNEYFEVINSYTFDSFEIDYITYDGKDNTITGVKKIDDKYHRYLYKIAIDGKPTKVDELVTDYKTYLVQARKSNDHIYLAFMDNHGNTYKINDDRIVDLYANDDNSYVYYSGCKMQKLSQDRSVIDEKTFSNCDSIRGVKYEDYYYVVSVKAHDEYIEFKLYKIDENLNVVAGKDLIEMSNVEDLDLESSDKFYNGYQFFIKNHSINFSSITKKIDGVDEIKKLKIKSDLSIELGDEDFDGFYNISLEKNNMSVTGVDMTTVNNLIKAKEKLKVSDSITVGVHSKKDGDNIMAFIEYAIKSGGNTYHNEYFVYFDNDLNEIFRYKCSEEDILGDDKFYTKAANYKDNIMLIITTPKGNMIKLLNKKGEELRDYSEDIKEYDYLTANNIYVGENGLYVYFALYSSKGVVHFDDGVDPTKQTVGVGPNLSPTGVLIYYTNIFNIYKKTDGHGSIKVNYEKADVGTVVRFTITPEKGYELDKVNVIDANGNVLTFTDYTFTMPSADVTIEASFKKIENKNPNTKDIAVITTGILSLCMFGIIIYSYKKYKQKRNS